MPNDGWYELYYKDSLPYLLVKNEKYSVFPGASATNHTGFSTPTFYHTFEHVMDV